MAVLNNRNFRGQNIVKLMQGDRNFIGIELDKGYFDIAKQRIESVVKE